MLCSRVQVFLANSSDGEQHSQSFQTLIILKSRPSALVDFRKVKLLAYCWYIKLRIVKVGPTLAFKYFAQSFTNFPRRLTGNQMKLSTVN